MSEPFVVKAQCSQFSTTGPHVLVYDSGKNIEFQFKATLEMVATIEAKSFWWAVLDGDHKVVLQTKATEKDFELFNYPTMNPSI